MLRMRSVGAGLGVTEVKLGQNLFLYNYPDVNNPYNVRPGEHMDFPSGLGRHESCRAETPCWCDSVLPVYSTTPLKYLQNCLRRVGYLFSPVPNCSSSRRF